MITRTIDNVNKWIAQLVGCNYKVKVQEITYLLYQNKIISDKIRMFIDVMKPHPKVIIVATILVPKYCILVPKLRIIRCLQLQKASYKIVEQLILIPKHSVILR